MIVVQPTALKSTEVLFTNIFVSREIETAGHIARMEEGRSVFKILTGKSKGKRS
jgi:hypothetical protein